MYIKDGVLRSCRLDPKLKRIVIPHGVREIYHDVFRGGNHIEEVVIPHGVEKIGAKAFLRCIKLKEVILPDTVRELGEGAFKLCHDLEGVRISAGLTEIPPEAFADCESLTEVYIPDGIVRMGRYAFGGCKRLRSIRLPETLAEFSSDSLTYGNSLKSLEIPPNTAFDSYVFLLRPLSHIRFRGMDVRWKIDVLDYCFLNNKRLGENVSDNFAKGIIDTGAVPPQLAAPLNIAYYVTHRDAVTGEYIRKNLRRVLDTIAETGNADALPVIIGDFITEDNADEYIEYAIGKEYHEIYLLLLEKKRQLGGFGGESESRFRL